MTTEIKEIRRDVTHMKESFASLSTDVKYIRKTLDGNGKKGLCEEVNANTEHRISTLGVCDEVNENTTHRIGVQAQFRLLKFAVGGGVVLNLLLFGASIVLTFLA